MRETRLKRFPVAPVAIVCFALKTVLLLSSEAAVAKNCTSSDITLADQGDVNLFQQAFSGGGTCDTVTGTLRIEDGGGTNITDLTPLRDLRYVNGDLIVYGNYQLATADGLEGIQRVGGDLNVSYNDQLGHCSALYELLTATPTTRVGVAGETYIAYNAAGCNSRTEVVETSKYNWEFCPAYAYDEVASSYGDELPVYELKQQSDVEELREIVGPHCNALPGLLKIGQEWDLGPSDITDLSSLSWIRNVWDLWIFNSPDIASETVNEGLGNLEGSINAIYIDWLGILDLDFLANLTEFKTKSYYWNPGAYIYYTPLSSLGPLSSLETPTDLTYFGWYIAYNAWLSDCEWPGDPLWNGIRVERNAPGCNTPDDVIANWNKPRYRLSMSSSPGGAMNYHNLSVSNNATSGYGWYTRNTQEMLSVGVPEGLNSKFSPSPNSPYEFSDFLSNCNGGTRSSTQEFILSSMENDCYLHVNYSRGPSDPSAVAVTKTLSGSSCKVVQPALEPKVEWREQGLLNVSDQAVEVICPLPRKSYLGRDQQYLSDSTAVAIGFSVDAVSTAHTDCALVAGESVGDFVAPATSNFRLHGWATDTGEITIRPESYPSPSTADVLSHHAIKCTLQPGVGISSLRIDSLKGESNTNAPGANNSGVSDGNCNVSSQIDFVETVIDSWYLWYDETASVNKNDHSSAQAYLNARLQPLIDDGRDKGFSYVTTITEDEAGISSGTYVGFGFRSSSTATQLFITDVFESGPAYAAGIRRGMELIAVDTGSGFETLQQLIDRNASTEEIFGPNTVGVSRTFRFQDAAGTSDYTISKVELAPPALAGQPLLIDRSGQPPVGYLNLRQFIDAALYPAAGYPSLSDAAALFKGAGVTDLIIDLRYNGGGLLRVADTMMDLLAGRTANGEPSYKIQVNDQHPEYNADQSNWAFFDELPATFSPSRIAFITSRSTASASELIINGLDPHLDVVLIGDNTFGKQVGQGRWDMHESVEDLSRSECDVALRLTAFEIVNGEDQGGYHQVGLEGTGRFTLCPAEDDLFSAFGDPTEASVSAALGWFDAGSCPSSDSAGARKVSADQKSMLPPWLPANFIPDRVDENLR